MADFYHKRKSIKFIGANEALTNRFTAYPNPYMVYNGSKYYKHIYVGSERIVSKVSVNNPDYDPRQENCAGIYKLLFGEINLQYS